MLLPDKVSQLSSDSNTVHDWVHGPASGIGSSVVTDSGLLRTPAKLIADKSVDVDAATSLAIAGNIAIVNTVANSIGNVNLVAGKLPEVQTVVTNIPLLNAVNSNIGAVQNVANNITAVNNTYTNMAAIQASSSNASIAAAAAAYLSTYVDNVVMNVTFPLDCGLITEPVLFNTFDLGAL